MIELDVDGGKYKLRYDGQELTYLTPRCRSIVCDENLEGLILALMRENISMKDKFAKLLDASNAATRAKVGFVQTPFGSFPAGPNTAFAEP